MIHFSIILYELVNNITPTKSKTRSEPALIGISKSILRAIAPPRISAKEVEIDANIAEPKTKFEYLGLR